MNKWGTKFQIGFVILFGSLLLDAFVENKGILLIGIIGGFALLLSSYYDSWKNKQKK
jgi:hypothetical protein|tara:strand:+ start:286 stop:456 length:171 start_codon:yes stop_codon:yes gene_type:complete